MSHHSSLEKTSLWLIRTETKKIIGPLSQQEMYNMLLTGKLKKQDEICEANDEWIFLHEKEKIKYFFNIFPIFLEDEKKEVFSDEVTETHIFYSPSQEKNSFFQEEQNKVFLEDRNFLEKEIVFDKKKIEKQYPIRKNNFFYFLLGSVLFLLLSGVSFLYFIYFLEKRYLENN